MTKPAQLTGQLSLFDPDTPTAKPNRKRRRTKPQRQPRWLGAGRCRSCSCRLPLYQATDRLLAWCHQTNALLSACPGCGITVTTTTTELVHEPQGDVS